jgi:hypothetical protein
MESIHANKHALEGLAISEEAKKASLDASTRKLILSEVFWEKLNGFLRLLKPIADAITAVEGDNKYLSIVMKVCNHVLLNFY